MSVPSPSNQADASVPPEAWPSLLRLARLARLPLERFLRIEAASGTLLLIAAALALVWANSGWRRTYFELWHMPLGMRFGGFTFERPLEWFVNDVLMVVFFFVVGMEIRREIAHGELSEWRRAALPAFAALGGMVAPAALYLLVAGGAPTRSGWGVPMATDIAFALGVLALLGKRVPAALRVLLLALAVIDDLGAIIVIAVFYSAGIALQGLLLSAVGISGVLLMQRFGVRAKLAYVAPATVVWAGAYTAGIHPTIAGVIVGMMTPVRPWLGREGFVAGVRHELDILDRNGPLAHSTDELAGSLRYVEKARQEARSPAEHLIEVLHPWVAYGIMPVFALANAGVSVGIGSLHDSSWRVFAAVIAGLAVGKPAGVLLACWLTLRFRIAGLPYGITYKHLVVLGVVAGVGFTMALFIANLAFTDAELLAGAKLGVLAASAAAGVIGWLFGKWLLEPVVSRAAASTADEAECSTEV